MSEINREAKQENRVSPEWLKRTDVIAMFNINDNQYRYFVREGIIPPPDIQGSTQRWHKKKLLAYFDKLAGMQDTAITE
ncbi:MAG: hypothetical protein M0Q44_01090 [Methylobacter sp.]|jgi:hypothetical protein|nr:hypothetical protein [Methylobacter sp.]